MLIFMEETKVTITKTMENNKAILSVEGWLDTSSAPELGREIEALSDIESLILDLINWNILHRRGFVSLCWHIRNLKV